MQKYRGYVCQTEADSVFSVIGLVTVLGIRSVCPTRRRTSHRVGQSMPLQPVGAWGVVTRVERLTNSYLHLDPLMNTDRSLADFGKHC